HILEGGAPQGLHAPPERADARKDDCGGLADNAGVSGESGVCADADQRFLGRAEVADAVVEHGDERRTARGRPARHRVPLVEGIPVPSSRTASRKQRPRPLNVASMTWWTLRPRLDVT